MKKSIFKKIGGLFLGLAMGLGVAAGVAAGNKASEVKAADTTVTQSSFSFTQAATVGPNNLNGDSNVTWTAYKGGAGTNPGNYNSGIRLYQAGSGKDYGGYVDVTAKNSKVIKSITVTLTSKSNSTTYKTKVDSGSMSSGSSLKASESFTLSNLSATTVGIYCCGTSSSTRMEIGSISVTYGTTGFDVTYNKNLPSGASESNLANWPSNVSGQSSYTIPSTKPSLPGYKFDGYAISESGAASKQPGDSITATTTLWGKWTAKTSVTLSAPNLELDLIDDAGGVAPVVNDGSITGCTFVSSSPNIVAVENGKIVPKTVTTSPVTITISHAEDDDNVYTNGSFTVSVTTQAVERSYSVSVTGGTCDSNSGSIFDGSMVLLTFTPSAGYKLPSLDGVAVTGTSSYDYDPDEGTLLIEADGADINVSVTMVALKLYTIQVSATNATYSGSTQIYENGTASVSFTPNSGYFIETNNITVSSNVTTVSKTASSVSLKNPTGSEETNVSITVVATKVELSSIEVTGTFKKAYKLGEEFDKTGMVVTAKYNNNTSKTVTSSAEIVGFDRFTITESTSITVSYTEGETTKTATVSGVSVSKVVPQAAKKAYVRVEAEPTSWAGTYLIAYDGYDTTHEKTFIYNGLDTAKNSGVEVSCSKNGEIAYDSNISQYEIIVAAVTGGYTWQISSNNPNANKGKYPYGGTSNGCSFEATSTHTSTFAYTGGDDHIVKINNNDKTQFKINTASDQMRFRYMTSASNIQLYKYVDIPGATADPIKLNAAFIGSNPVEDDVLSESNVSASLYYNDDTTDDTITGYTFDPSTLSAGEHDYTVSYYDSVSKKTFTDVITIDAESKATLTSITLNTDGVKTSFVKDEEFSAQGLVVTAHYDKAIFDHEIDIDDLHFSGFDSSAAADSQTITVSYTEGGVTKTETYDIEILDQEGIQLNSAKNPEIFVGKEYNLSLTLVNATEIVTNWDYSPKDSGKFSVSNTSGSLTGYTATITGVEATATPIEITISVTTSKGSLSETINLTVSDDYINDIDVSVKTGKEFKAGETLQLSDFVVMASYASGDGPTQISSGFKFSDNAPTGKLSIKSYTFDIELTDNSEVKSSVTINVGVPEMTMIVGEEIEGQTTYELATTLESGKDYIFVGINNDKYYAMKVWDGSSNNFKAEEVPAPVDDVITLDETNDVATVTATYNETSKNWTFFDQYYYLYAAGGTGKNNYMKGAANANNTNAHWTIDSTDADSNSDTFAFKTADSGVVRNTMMFNYNNGSPVFSCYANGQKEFYLYEAVTHGGGYEYVEESVTANIYNFIEKFFAGDSTGSFFECDPDGVNSVFDRWNKIKETDEWSLLSADEESLQNLVNCVETDGKGNYTDEYVWEFLEFYDYVCGKYPEKNLNFLDRNVSSAPTRINPIVSLDEVDNSVWVISAVALVGLTAIGGYFFYRKRKEI